MVTRKDWLQIANNTLCLHGSATSDLTETEGLQSSWLEIVGHFSECGLPLRSNCACLIENSWRGFGAKCVGPVNVTQARAHTGVPKPSLCVTKVLFLLKSMVSQTAQSQTLWLYFEKGRFWF